VLGDIIGHILFKESLREWVNFSDRHEMLDVIISDLGSPVLKFFNKLLQNFNENFLNVTSEHFTAAILYSYLFQLVIVFEEKH